MESLKDTKESNQKTQQKTKQQQDRYPFMSGATKYFDEQHDEQFCAIVILVEQKPAKFDPGLNESSHYESSYKLKRNHI